MPDSLTYAKYSSKIKRSSFLFFFFFHLLIEAILYGIQDISN